MTSLTLAAAVELRDGFLQQFPDAPFKVRAAVSVIVTCAAHCGRVPTDLITFVRGWIARQQQQDRFGQ